jgi:catechol 2,3-dioxygenase-like lactoylglutathione lyase family enzyme
MIEGVQVVSVPVSDQDEARAFYIDTLGFELRTENSFGEGMRWIEVAPKDTTTSLTLVTWFEAMAPDRRTFHRRYLPLSVHAHWCLYH